VAKKQPPEYGNGQMQKTPKGLEIPVPKRKDVMDMLGKVSPAPKKPKR
jgi:hypothetical protein